MQESWTIERVLQLAPDPASAKAGQGLGSVRKWVTMGREEVVLWGECQGSGEVHRVRRSILGQMVSSSPCTRCGGTGEEVTSPCGDCRGEGRVTEERAYTVDVPAGELYKRVEIAAGD